MIWRGLHGKRGFLFTISLLFAAGAVFSFALFIQSMHNTESTRYSQSIAEQQLHDLSTSIEKSIREIILAQSGVSLLINGNSAVFESDVPSFASTGLSNLLSDLEEVLLEEEEDGRVILDTDAILQTMMMSVDTIDRRGVVNYTLPDFSSGGGDVGVELSDADVNHTYLAVEFLVENVSSCVWDTQPGSMGVHIRVFDESLQAVECDESLLVDPTYSNTLQVNNEYGVMFDGSGVYTINTGNFLTRSFVNVTLGSRALEVYIPSQVISINHSAFDAGRTSGVSLITSGW